METLNMPSSSFLVFYWVISATSVFRCFQLSTAGNNATERSALLEIKAKISGDPLGVMSSWNDTLHFCEWYGVTCGRDGVTILDLHSAKLTGTLSSHIGNLSFLVELRLDDNSFGGTIPPEIGRLHRLRTLWLSSNFIEGEIPSNVSGCHTLTNINLGSNKLVGGIPPELGSLSRLQFISLIGNNLTGNIPSSLGNLSSSLSFLSVAQNNLVGKISSESMGKLKNLTGLSLEENMFYGTVPPSIFNLSLLTQLSLRQNDLHGDLPSDLGNTLPHLTFLSLGSNRFTGRVPASISNSSNLESLQLNDNNFRAQVPPLHKLLRLSYLVLSNNSLGDLNFVSSLSNATNLQWLQIDQNNFQGVLPRTICNFSMLTRLVIHHNRIAGEIPMCIEDLAHLRILLANDNTLSGTLPLSIGKLQDLYLLKLNDNQLSGTIPHSIGNLTKLSTFSLSNNRFEGQIPVALGNCSSLTGLFLGNNSLSGRIPSQLFSLPTLPNVNAIDLSRNHLTGYLPEEVGRLNNMKTFIVTRNMLSGKIPSSLSSCIALEFLYLSRNVFQGTIPDALRSLKGLLELDLSYNNLSGEIPQFLASLRLLLLNVSHNNLQGEVPIGGVFNNATTVLVSGNSRLCGGIPELKLPHCNFSSRSNTRKRRSAQKKKLTIAILSCLSGVIFLLVILVLLCQRKRTKEPTPFGYLENFPNVSYRKLFKATNGFSLENLIGSGAFGFVYRGTLNEDGPKVAIKVFKLEHHGSLKSFMAECAVLRSIRHRNLLKVITSCSSVDDQGRDFKALVYEYMANGSLEDWLHPPNAARRLNLRQRFDIAVDVAFSLDYLHHQCSAPVVHCDLKPSNVLVDEDMVAHVGDFGIAKILLQGNINANQSSSINGIRGTIGYTPPEYGLGEDVSTSGDVYSFGILLLEMFTGKRPTNEMFRGGLSLHCFVGKARLPQEITTVVDHALLQDIDGEEETALEALTCMLRIALSCSTEVPRGRPDMTVVSTNLSSIRSNLFNYHRKRFYTA